MSEKMTHFELLKENYKETGTCPIQHGSMYVGVRLGRMFCEVCEEFL